MLDEKEFNKEMELLDERWRQANSALHDLGKKYGVGRVMFADDEVMLELGPILRKKEEIERKIRDLREAQKTEEQKAKEYADMHRVLDPAEVH